MGTQEQTVLWRLRDPGVKCLFYHLQASHFTAALPTLFVFERDTPPTRQQASLIKVPQTTSVTQPGL